jgi:hypothetical protein
MLKHCFFCLFFIKNEYYFVSNHCLLSSGQIIILIFYGAKARSIFQPPRNQLVVPKTNQEINAPSYEIVGVKITVTNYGQNNRIFGIFFLVDFLFSSLTTPNDFIVMVLKCTC